jgi:hypothetical protein
MMRWCVVSFFGCLVLGGLLTYYMWPTYVYIDDSTGLYHTQEHVEQMPEIEEPIPLVTVGRAKLLGYYPDHDCLPDSAW